MGQKPNKNEIIEYKEEGTVWKPEKVEEPRSDEIEKFSAYFLGQEKHAVNDAVIFCSNFSKEIFPNLELNESSKARMITLLKEVDQEIGKKVKFQTIFIQKISKLLYELTSILFKEKKFNLTVKFSIEGIQCCYSQNYQWRLYNMQGLSLRMLGKYEKALWAFRMALDSFRDVGLKGNEKGVAMVRSNIAEVLSLLVSAGKNSDYQTNDEKIKQLEESLRIFRKIDDKKRIFNTCLKLGNIYMEEKRWEDSLKIFEESVGFFSKVGESDKVFYCLKNLIKVNYLDGNYDIASDLSVQLEEYARKNEVDVEMINAIQVRAALIHLGRTYKELQDFEENAITGLISKSQKPQNSKRLLPHDEKAISIFSTARSFCNQQRYEDGIISCLTSIGWIYLIVEDYEKANGYFNDAFEISKNPCITKGECILCIGTLILCREKSKQIKSNVPASFCSEAFDMFGEAGLIFEMFKYKIGEKLCFDMRMECFPETEWDFVKITSEKYNYFVAKHFTLSKKDLYSTTRIGGMENKVDSYSFFYDMPSPGTSVPIPIIKSRYQQNSNNAKYPDFHDGLITYVSLHSNENSGDTFRSGTYPPRVISMESMDDLSEGQVKSEFEQSLNSKNAYSYLVAGTSVDSSNKSRYQNISKSKECFLNEIDVNSLDSNPRDSHKAIDNYDKMEVDYGVRSELEEKSELLKEVKNSKLCDFIISKRLGKTEVRRFGYFGANAAVFLCHHKIFPEHPLAIKFVLNYNGMGGPSDLSSIHKRYLSKDVISQERLTDHPNVIRVLHHFFDTITEETFQNERYFKFFNQDILNKNTCFIVYDFFENNLCDFVSDQKDHLSEFSVLLLMNGIIDGICHIHENLLVHRDLKLDNIMLSKMGNPVIIDFGEHLDAKTQTKSDFIVPYREGFSIGGCPKFLPPEIVDRQPANDVFLNYSKCDVFSAGMIFYYILTLRRDCFNANVERTDQNYMDFRNCAESYSNGVKNLVAKMVKCDANERFSCFEAQKEISIILNAMRVKTENELLDQVKPKSGLKVILDLEKEGKDPTPLWDPEDNDLLEI